MNEVCVVDFGAARRVLAGVRRALNRGGRQSAASETRLVCGGSWPDTVHGQLPQATSSQATCPTLLQIPLSRSGMVEGIRPRTYTLVAGVNAWACIRGRVQQLIGNLIGKIDHFWLQLRTALGSRLFSKSHGACATTRPAKDSQTGPPRRASPQGNASGRARGDGKKPHYSPGQGRHPPYGRSLNIASQFNYIETRLAHSFSSSRSELGEFR